MSNLERFKKGLMGEDDEITSALKAEFSDDWGRVMLYLSAQASVSRPYNKVMRWMAFGAGLLLGLGIAVIVGVLS